MTRKRKSRKPGRGSSGIIKQDSTVVFDKDKRVRKKTGNKPGSRQLVEKKTQSNQTKQKIDPRVGSVKPIALVKTTPVEKPTQNKPKVAPIAKVVAVREVENAQSALWQELERIENDEQLLLIVEKMDNEEALTEEEVDTYNTLMARHEEISAELGIDEEEETSESTSNEDLSEDELWQKFNDNEYDFE